MCWACWAVASAGLMCIKITGSSRSTVTVASITMTGFQRLRRKFKARPPWSKAPTTACGVGDLVRLPAEIRTQIWQQVLGKSLWHMTIDPDSQALRSYRCRTFHQDPNPWEVARCQYPLTEYVRARCFGIHPDPDFFFRPQKMPLRALELLCTSRAIYEEAIEVL